MFSTRRPNFVLSSFSGRLSFPFLSVRSHSFVSFVFIFLEFRTNGSSQRRTSGPITSFFVFPSRLPKTHAQQKYHGVSFLFSKDS